MTKNLHHYTESLFYQLSLTAKYCRALALEITEKVGCDLYLDEVVTLDTVSCNPGICQRDLAKILLKDRANVGRTLDALEKKELVHRYDDRKNNRLVRKVEISEKGKELLISLGAKFDSAHAIFAKIIPDDEAQQLLKRLKKIQKNASKVVDLQI